MLKDLLERWPAYRQFTTGADGTGPEAMSDATHRLQPKIQDCDMTRSVCPYCGVGCGQVIFHKDDRIVQIEGDPDSPISRGRLCPKGANTKELHTHPARLKKVKYRRPFSACWEELDLETAMDMLADRAWRSREESFVEERDGEPVVDTETIAHLGG